MFAVIALGFLLTRAGFLSDRALRDLNSLTYWVGLPSLLLHRVRLIGLNGVEYDAACDYLLTPCTPHSMTPEEFEATLMERCPGEPDIMPVKTGGPVDDAPQGTP